MIQRILQQAISKAEKRIGVELDYARKIAATDLGLLRRYGKIFSFLDPKKKVPAAAYHIARLRGPLDAEDREIVLRAYGEAGLIEPSFAMAGAALLPGIKRAMGYATTCHLDTIQKMR